MSHPRAGSMVSRVVITEGEARRVDAFVMRCRGKQRTSAEAAAERLGIGLRTVLNAIERGQMMRSTRDRLFAALDREEGRTP